MGTSLTGKGPPGLGSPAGVRQKDKKSPSFQFYSNLSGGGSVRAKHFKGKSIKKL